MTTTKQKPAFRGTEATKMPSVKMKGCRKKNNARENTVSLNDGKNLGYSENSTKIVRSSSSNDTNTSLRDQERSIQRVPDIDERHVSGESSHENDAYSEVHAETKLLQQDSKRYKVFTLFITTFKNIKNKKYRLKSTKVVQCSCISELTILQNNLSAFKLSINQIAVHAVSIAKKPLVC